MPTETKVDTVYAVAPGGAQSGVHHLLHQLGDHPDTMAAELHRLGVTGERDHSERCVLANYLRARLDCDFLYVSEAVITVFWYGAALVDCDDVDTTPQVAAFVVAFDKGDYPQLITRGGAR